MRYCPRFAYLNWFYGDISAVCGFNNMVSLGLVWTDWVEAPGGCTVDEVGQEKWRGLRKGGVDERRGCSVKGCGMR